MDFSLLRKPSAFLPIAMSVAALAGIALYVATVGIPENPVPHDEDAPARLFQLSLVVQALIIGVFAMKWLPRAPKQAISVLVLQAAGIVAAIGTIVVLER